MVFRCRCHDFLLAVKPAAVAVGVDVREQDTLDEVVLEDICVSQDLDRTVYDLVACLGNSFDGSFAAQGIHADDFFPVASGHEPHGFVARSNNIEHIVDFERNKRVPVERRIDYTSGQNQGIQRYRCEFFGTESVEIFGKDIGAERVTECGNPVAVLAVFIADLVSPFPKFFNNLFPLRRVGKKGYGVVVDERRHDPSLTVECRNKI